jgi:hypothetical protein
MKEQPKGSDFGADDNTSLEYARDNNFYYIPNQAFQVPTRYYKPLNGENAFDGKFVENPANGPAMARDLQNQTLTIGTKL